MESNGESRRTRLENASTEGGSTGRTIRIAITGNPNSGKTTIFNQLTGFRQRVANYPGVTVEKSEGELLRDGKRLLFSDLPGIYSLTPFSVEELGTRKILLEDKPDVVVDVLDATNLERNLYLATQLLELGVPLVLSLNMSDEARARGIQFDLDRLSTLLGVPIVPTVGNKRHGIGNLMDRILEVAGNGFEFREVRIPYGTDIEEELAGLEELVRRERILFGEFNSRWIAVKLLETDQDIVERVRIPEVISAAMEASRRLETRLGEKPSVIMADRRYGFISGACQEAVRSTVEARHTMSDKIDEVIMSEALGIPILLLMMYLVFHFTFTLGNPIMDAMDWGFQSLGSLVAGFWPVGSHSPLKSLLVDGIISGVGGVVIFLPNILLLFLAISVLEDTGYMMRGAFVMDRLMHKIGLHGKSFVPLLIGFGCSVPAIMATRTLESRRDRMITMLITPLISCSGRLPVYALIIPAFFPQRWQAPVLWMVYMTGILLAIAAAKLLSRTVFRVPSEPFVMELPPYRMPTARSVLVHMWDRGKMYVKKAGTFILGISILLWVFTAFPRPETYPAAIAAAESGLEQSYEQGVERTAGMLGLTGTGRRLLAGSLDGAGGADEASPGSGGVTDTERERVSRFLWALDHLQEQGDVPAGGDVAAAARYFSSEVREPYLSGMRAVERRKHVYRVEYSVVGQIGRGLAKVLSPLGFDWKISTALIGSFAAKEVFVAQMAIIQAVADTAEGESTLRQRLRENYPPLVAVCILLFVLIGTPCMATLAIIRKESESWKWAFLQWGGVTALAYVVTLIVYQAGSLLGLGV